MATKKTTLLSNRGSLTAAPTPNDPANERGKVRSVNGTVALATGDIDAADIIMLCGLPSNAVVLQIWIANDDLDSNGSPTITANVGLYADVDGATAKDADVYSTVTTQLQGASGFVDHAFEARGIEKMGQKVYEDAGDSSDTNVEYFLGVTIGTGAATAAAGDLSFNVVYAVE